MNMKRSILRLLAAGALSALAVVAADQPTPVGTGPGGGAGGPRGGPGGGPGGPGFGARGNFQGPGRGGMAALDAEQRHLFQEALQKESAKLRGLNEKLRLAQQDLMAAVLTTNYDEKVVQAKGEAMAKIQVEIITLRAEALATVAPSLKPEQRQQLIDSPGGFALLSAGGVGGPAFGGPRGNGPGGFGGPGGGAGFGPSAEPGGGQRGGPAGFAPGGPGSSPGAPSADGFPPGATNPKPRER